MGNNGNLGQTNQGRSSPISLQKGDIFIVQDANNETYTHRGIKIGLWATRNNHPNLVHAGIALDSENTIEASGSGLGHFKLNDIHGQKLIVFRCKDPKVSDLAADLAYNMEKNYLTEHRPSLITPESTKKIRYGFGKAIWSGPTSNQSKMSAQQLAEVTALINTFNFAGEQAVKHGLFCSELVMLVFAMSKSILTGNAIDVDSLPITCNLHFTNPSQLYDNLCSQPELWDRIDMQVERSENGVELLSVEEVAEDTAESSSSCAA